MQRDEQEQVFPDPFYSDLLCPEQLPETLFDPFLFGQQYFHLLQSMLLYQQQKDQKRR
jgi:hypothetical protein